MTEKASQFTALRTETEALRAQEAERAARMARLEAPAAAQSAP